MSIETMTSETIDIWSQHLTVISIGIKNWLSRSSFRALLRRQNYLKEAGGGGGVGAFGSN